MFYRYNRMWDTLDLNTIIKLLEASPRHSSQNVACSTRTAKTWRMVKNWAVAWEWCYIHPSIVYQDPALLEKLLLKNPEETVKFKVYKRDRCPQISSVDRRLTRVKNMNRLPIGVWARWVVESISFILFADVVTSHLPLSMSIWPFNSRMIYDSNYFCIFENTEKAFYFYNCSH